MKHLIALLSLLVASAAHGQAVTIWHDLIGTSPGNQGLGSTHEQLWHYDDDEGGFYADLYNHTYNGSSHQAQGPVRIIVLFDIDTGTLTARMNGTTYYLYLHNSATSRYRLSYTPTSYNNFDPVLTWNAMAPTWTTSDQYTAGDARPEIAVNEELFSIGALLHAAAQNSGGGGSGGVDADDWDYWFDEESGRFLDLADRWDYYFGDEENDGYFKDALDDIGTSLDVLQSILFSINQLINLSGGSMPETIDTSAMTLDPTEAFDEFSPSSMLPSEDLVPNGTDNTAAPVFSFRLDLNQWFGGWFPGMPVIDAEIDMQPFAAIRDIIHVVMYGLVSVWVVLDILEETRKR